MKLDGPSLYALFISAANALDNNKDVINNMNVFPVPDGDTGINMSLTLDAVRKLEESYVNNNVSEISKKIASLILRAARGNSGAILSLFFRGMSKAFCDLEEVDTTDIARAFRKGTDEAYRAVMNPTEGTILTVMRKCAEAAEEAVKEERFEKTDVRGFFAYIVDIGEEALSKTPDQLPILKEVNVVDAGGLGFMTALNGMLSALNGKPVARQGGATVNAAADFESFNTEDITFPYCTECIVEKSEDFEGEDKAANLNEFVCGIGDSVVFAEDDSIIKIHVHTDHPGLVLEKACEYGTLATVKIENMRKQHSALVSSNTEAEGDADNVGESAVAPSKKKYGFVSVCLGQGIRDTFVDLGVDNIVFGGQTMNPSTQDIIDGVCKTPSEIVYVLPNNKNIYLVAQQAAKLIDDKKVVVLQTKNVPQGIGAMLAFDPDANEQENTSAMEAAIASVTGMSVTHAVRDTTIDGEHIGNGQMMGLVDGSIECVADTCEACIEGLTLKMGGASYITIFYGEDVSDAECERTVAIIKDAVPDAEIVAIFGGQPIYNYIISVE